MSQTRTFFFPAVVSLVLATFVFGCTQDSATDTKKTEIKSKEQQVSYSIGIQLGRHFSGQFQQQGIEIDADAFAQAVRDAFSGSELAMTDEEMTKVMDDFQVEQEAAYKAKLAGNLEKASAFLAENAKKDGVVTLPDSVQYMVIEEGSGASPKPEDTVKVNYTGTLLDGTKFDSSYDHDDGGPAIFPLQMGIRGWTVALQRMKPGAKWKVWIPPGMAYGERGSPPVIEPNSLIVFEIELLEIVKQDQ